jgi:hypothetical protein
MVGVFSDELPSAPAMGYCVRLADNEKPPLGIIRRGISRLGSLPVESGQVPPSLFRAE